MDTPSQSPPRVSVVVITPDCYETIRQTVRHLGAQTIVRHLELLICARSREDLKLAASELESFHSWRIVEVGPFNTMGDAKCIAVGEARSGFVIFAEDHSFPEPGWAAALLEAHAAGHCAAGPQVQNANPQTTLSWADLFMGFAPWIAPLPAGVRERLPAHNTGYDRELLLAQGKNLVVMLDNEALLQWKLRAEGRTLFLADVVTRHVNVSLLGSYLLVQYHGGRSFGHSRAAELHWGWSKRLVYILGAPLVPPLRLWRTLKLISACGRSHELVPRILPTLFAGLCAHAAGEAMGTAFGDGGSTRRKADFEFHRDHHVRESDKALWAV